MALFGLGNLFKRALTDEEKDQRVFELREALSQNTELKPEEYSDEHALRRFLIARDFDLKKATELFTKDILWRREHKPDQVGPDECPNLLKSGVTFWHGHDREGRPLLYLRDRFHNPKERTIEEMGKFAQHLMEEGIRNMPEGVTQFRVVQNQEGFTRANMDQAGAKVVLETLQDHYPERLYKAHVINYGMLFWVLWKLISIFMTQRTKDKIQHMGSDWKDKLREDIDPEQLLVECGGLDPYVHPFPEGQDAVEGGKVEQGEGYTVETVDEHVAGSGDEVET